MSDDEQRISQYLAELRDAASLSRGDLDEIEDHLRTLAGELRERGTPAAQAVTEAARRLGEPRAIAREHARVRNAFGAPLSRMRAWSAAALCGVVAWSDFSAARAFDTFDVVHVLNIGLDVALMIAMIARCGWARAMLFGGAISMVIGAIVWGAAGASITAGSATWAVACLGAAVLVAPWRRRELNAAGLALALLPSVYLAVLTVFDMNMYREGAELARDPVAIAAIVGMFATTLGGMVRARWASIVGSITAGSILVASFHTWQQWGHELGGRAAGFAIAVQIALGVACAVVAAVVLSQTARSRFGSLRLIAD